jgi:hypothetical protein
MVILMGDIKKTLTFDLFARPSFIEGMSRVMDLGSNLQVYNHSKTELDADAKAIHNDWRMVGKDIESSIEEYKQKN